jgi:H+/Cl- antiporter ClcA
LRWLFNDKSDQNVVLAAGAGAGLAVALNAPIGGSVFVLARRIEHGSGRFEVLSFRSFRWPEGATCL